MSTLSTLHTPQLNPRALSPNGYIIDQGMAGDIPYGRMPSDYNGCGWIAAYNFMLALGPPAGTGDAAGQFPPPPALLSRQLAAGSPFRCMLGTGPRRLRRFLQARGYALAATWRRGDMPTLAAGARAGILLYLAGAEPHFVAFAAAPDGRLRFFNAHPGNAAHLCTMEEFLRTDAWFPITYLMVNNDGTK